MFKMNISNDKIELIKNEIRTLKIIRNQESSERVYCYYCNPCNNREDFFKSYDELISHLNCHNIDLRNITMREIKLSANLALERRIKVLTMEKEAERSKEKSELLEEINQLKVKVYKLEKVIEKFTGSKICC